MDRIPVNIAAPLGLYVHDFYSYSPDNVTRRPWSCIIIRQNSLELIKEWSLQMIRADDHLYVQHKAYFQLFYTLLLLHKTHKQFTHPAASRLYE